MLANKHILIIVENLPVPFDRRVWQEASSLKENGYDITIICPKTEDYPKKYECIDGIDIYRHYLPREADTAWGYFHEYSVALYWEFLLSWRIYFKKKFQVIHGCNPPDLVFLVALCFKLLGVKYVFDHHDINPELYIAKFKKKNFFYRLMLLFERFTFITADYSIAPNESYKEIAINRGKMHPGNIAIVRSGPSLQRLKITAGNEKYKMGRKYLVGYVGVIGKQEGLDLLLESAKIICSTRNDVQFAILGGGTELENLKRLSLKLGLEEFVTFYGRVPDDLLVEVLNTSDVCVNPDKPSEMNNLSTMNKIMEYMALKKPMIMFKSKEGQFTAQDASFYVEHNDVSDFAAKILWLLEHDTERLKMGESGYSRILDSLLWDYQKLKLISLYKSLLE